MTGYESKRAAARDKLVVTDIDGHIVRDVRKPKKAAARDKLVDDRRAYYEKFDDLYAVYLNGVYDGKKAAQRPWVGLTEEEIKECFKITPDLFLPWHIYTKIEAKLKEKNNG